MTDSPTPSSPSSPVPEPARRGRLRALFTRDRARHRPAGTRRWWPLPVGVLAGAVCGAAYGVLTTPEYTATSYVVAVPAKDAQPAAALGLAQAYGHIATSDATLALARAEAGVPGRALREGVRTETSPDSPMIAITGTSHRPRQAADIANAVADAVFVTGNQVARSTGVRLVSFAQAIPPRSPSSPGGRLSAAVGGAAGGLLGGLVLLVRPRREATPPSAPVPAPGAAPDAGSRERH
ncbi:YveK family protein [Streptomyces sp. NPDC057638]|uniref:YveK family protein n=1 Tax=Streptomyces sp. NPDC057638 TaxID=3346190 RepID=UPI003676AB98